MSKVNPAHPLTDTHLQSLQNGLNVIANTEKQIALAKQAGIDVSALEQQLNDTKQRILQIKNTYFPGR